MCWGKQQFGLRGYVYLWLRVYPGSIQNPLLVLF